MFLNRYNLLLLIYCSKHATNFQLIFMFNMYVNKSFVYICYCVYTVKICEYKCIFTKKILAKQLIRKCGAGGGFNYVSCL